MSNKRLYRANQGAMLFGVCQGIANYFNIDATIVRLIWAVLAISSVGFGFHFICCLCFYYSTSSNGYSPTKTSI